MSHYEYFSEVDPVEARLQESIRSSGIQPELLAELSVSDARFVLLSTYKALSTLTHPDRGTDRTVFGMDIREINSQSGTIGAADDEALTAALRTLNTVSPLAAERAERQQLQASYELLRVQNERLSHQLLNPEAWSGRITGKFAFDVLPADLEGELHKELLELELTNGVVTAGSIVPAQRMLASKASPEAQAFVATIRPNLEGPEKLIYIDSETAEQTGLPPQSWCRLVTARSTKSKKTVAGIKIYNPRSDDAYDDTSLVGATLLGVYSPQKDTVSSEHRALASAVDEELMSALYVNRAHAIKLNATQLARLVAQSHIQQPDDVLELVGGNSEHRHIVFTKQSKARSTTGIFVDAPIDIHLS